MAHYNIKSSIREKCLCREAKLSFVSPEESREVPVLFASCKCSWLKSRGSACPGCTWTQSLSPVHLTGGLCLLPSLQSLSSPAGPIMGNPSSPELICTAFYLFPLFPHLFPIKCWDRMPWSLFSECRALSQLFHSPLSLSSRGFLVPLHFLSQGWHICISKVIDISPRNLDSSLCFLPAQHFSWCTLHIS